MVSGAALEQVPLAQLRYSFDLGAAHSNVNHVHLEVEDSGRGQRDAHHPIACIAPEISYLLTQPYLILAEVLLGLYLG